MIRSRRVLDAPALRARHAIAAWVERHARLHATETARVVCDDRFFVRAFGRTDVLGRAVVTVVLAGRARLELPDAKFELGAGDGAVLPSKAQVLVRTEGDPYESLVLEWDPMPSVEPGEEPAHDGARPPFARFHVDDLAGVRAIAERVHQAPLPEPSRIVELVTLLRRAGAPITGLQLAPHAEIGARESRFQELADAIDALLATLHEQPMSADLEARLDVSSRQLTRLVEAYNERYGFGATNWLDTRNRRRLLLAAAFLTAPDASVAEVAQLVGYRRPETMARAFANAGYPTPSRVRGIVARLEDAWRIEHADGGLAAPPSAGSS